MGASHNLVLCDLTHGGFLYSMSFDFIRMEGGELYYDQCMSLLLADYIQGVGAAKPNARLRCTGSVHKSGV